MTQKTTTVLKIISGLGLALSIIPALLVFRGTISKDDYFRLIELGMVMWFASAVFWIKPDHGNA